MTSQPAQKPQDQPTPLQEAVARAIHEAGHGVPLGDWDETVSCGELNWEVENVRIQAQAAIRAVLDGIEKVDADVIDLMSRSRVAVAYKMPQALTLAEYRSSTEMARDRLGIHEAARAMIRHIREREA